MCTEHNKGEGLTIGARGKILRRAEVGSSFLTIACQAECVILHHDECSDRVRVCKKNQRAEPVNWPLLARLNNIGRYGRFHNLTNTSVPVAIACTPDISIPI
jgi:hypothetical protein